jgi:GTP-binding protein HflX
VVNLVGTGCQIIVSDTVGFISELPTQLVAAFHATLEEVQAAELVLHVRDITHPDTEAQRSDVKKVLTELGIENNRVLEVLNKIDRLPLHEAAALDASWTSTSGGVPISAISGAGCNRLLQRIAVYFTANRQVAKITVSLSDGKTLAWLYKHGKILARYDDDAFSHLRVSLAPEDLDRINQCLSNKKPPKTR